MNDKGDVLFKDQKIKTLKNESGGPQYVSANDICAILSRESLIADGTVVKRCPSVCRPDEDAPDEIFIVLSEAVALVRWIGRKNRIVEALCSELAGELEKLQGVVNGESAVASLPVVQQLQYGNTRFTMKMEDGRVMFNATEIARGYDRRPTEWLNMSETQKFRKALVDSGKSSDLESQIVTTRGAHGATWIEIHLLMNLAQWLSPDFAAWCSRTLAKLISEGEVNLADMPFHTKPEPERPTSVMALPETYEEAVQVIQKQSDIIREKEQIIEQNKEKVEFYEDVIGKRDFFTTQQIAFELGTHAPQLNIFLGDLGIQEKRNGKWHLKPQFRALQGTFKLPWENPKTKYIHGFKTIAWTPEGRQYIVTLWKEKYS